MDRQPSPSERITDTVLSWPGVTAGFGRHGEFAFRVGGREIGHLHGDGAAHFVFDKALWVELKATGRIEPHPIFPHRQGPAARRIGGQADIDEVIALMRLNYEAATARLARSA